MTGVEEAAGVGKPASNALAWLYLVSAVARRLGMLVAVLALLRYGVTLHQAGLQHETVASVDRAWVNGTACLATSLELFKLLHEPRLKGKSEEEIVAEHGRQCAGGSTSGSNVALELTWNDAAMKEHKTSVLLSPATADMMIRGGRLSREAVVVRYDPANPSASLVLVEEIENSKRESLYLFGGSVLAVLLGFAGGYLFRVLVRPA
jgi:hypothetical protein